MELVEAAAVIGAAERTRTYIGDEFTKIADMYDTAMTNLSILLNMEWTWSKTTTVLTLLACIGTFANILFLSSFKMSQKLVQISKENIFLTGLGWSDMMITALVVPGIVLLLMFKATDSTFMCHILQLITQWSTYTYSLSYMTVSIDIHNQIVRHNKKPFVKLPTYVLVLFNFCISLVTAYFGVYFELDYDYCHRKHTGNFWFRWVTMVIFYVIPCYITTSLFLKTTDLTRENLAKTGQLSKIVVIKRERDLCIMHTTCYYLFVTAWIPYLVTVVLFPDTSNDIYYAFAWSGLLRSGLTSLFYGVMNKNFRKAFVCVLNYLFCKVEVARPLRNHRVRRIENAAQQQNIRILAREVAETHARPPLVARV